MKILLKIAFLLLWPLAANAAGLPNLALVESVPEGTVYGSTQTLRPQAVWLDMIKGARHTLDIEVFYVSSQKGKALEPVLAELRRAAARGVKVRLLADAVFYKKMPDDIKDLRGRKNITVRLIYFSKFSGSGIMHAKYFIADGETLFVGSQNMDWRALSQIHETGIFARSRQLAQAFSAVFETDWELAGGGSFNADKRKIKTNFEHSVTMKYDGEDAEIYPFFSPPQLTPSGAEWELDEIISAIDGAKKELAIHVMNYSTKGPGGGWTEIDDALRRAAARGVKVRAIFANWTMAKSQDEVKALSQVPNIEVRISSVPQSASGFIEFARVEHCKYLVADDDTSLVSTSNWEYDYFYGSRDAGLCVQSEKFAAALKDVFNISWKAPYTEPVDLERDYAPVKRNKTRKTAD